jgi:acetyl-CoA carboxylase carboxyl transferase subunit alpha
VYSLLEKEAIVKKLVKQLEELKVLSKDEGIDVSQEIAILEEKIEKIKKEIWNSLEPWDRVQIARSANRLTALDYIDLIFDDFTELHGDRLYGDDGAIVGGIALLDQRPVTIIAEQKGRNTKENISRNFGMPNPEGYRKALRLMKQAEKFHRPIICFVDTPGAYCGLGAEERGQGEAIARNLMEMSALKVPILSIVIGEGGSGGALALAVANEVWMLENSIYSILSPEGFATILWKDSKKAEQASKVMKITAADLLELGMIERIIKEPDGGVENDKDTVVKDLKEQMISFFKSMDQLSIQEITDLRYEKFRKTYS